MHILLLARLYFLDAFLPHLKLLLACKKSCGMHSNWHIALPSSQALHGGYPVKAIAKNIASLITYPHSEMQRLEKRLWLKGN